MSVIRAQELRSLAFGSTGASYVAVGSGFEKPAVIVKIQNNTDADMYFSFDGVVDHLMVPAETTDVYDIGTNKRNNNGLVFAQGTVVYVKRLGTPTTGSVYVSMFNLK